MKIKLFAAGLASVLALGAMSSSVFAENITPSGSENESTGSSEVEHIISESYLINIPSKITLDSGTEPNFTGIANVSASNVRLGAGSTLTVSVKSNNGSLKIVSDAITSTIPYTISINNQTAVNASDMVSEYSDVFTMEAGETTHSSVPLNFSTTSFSNVKLAGEHKDMLSFRVDVVAAPTPEMPFAVNLYDDGQQHQLTDLRDGKQYWTAKIGNTVWMTQNLNYASEGATWDSDGIENASADIIFTDGTAYSTGGNDAHFSQGAYYTWNAAMNSCPQGWKLPSENQMNELIELQLNNYGYSSSDIGYLYESGNIHIMQQLIISNRFYGIRAGYIGFWNSNIEGFGVSGNYWSSSLPEDWELEEPYVPGNYAKSLGFTSDGDLYITNDEKNQGYSVRCVAG